MFCAFLLGIFLFNDEANGLLTNPGPKVLEPLYSGNLELNVITKNESVLIKRLAAKLTAEVEDSFHPFLLKQTEGTTKDSAVGVAWIGFTNCHLHYDITISGLSKTQQNLEVHLEFLPNFPSNVPVSNKFLNEFQGTIFEGQPNKQLTLDEMIKLDSGRALLRIKDKTTKINLLSANLQKLKVPENCLPIKTDNDVPNLKTIVTFNKTCLYEGHFYQDRSQWTSTVNPCKMCYCQNGDTTCDVAVCPELNCPNYMPIQKKIPSECCPVCAFASHQEPPAIKASGCMFGGKFYTPGAKFHPFLIQTGFDFCTECTCEPTTLEVKCNRQLNEELCVLKTMKDSDNGTLVKDGGHNAVELYKKKKPVRSAEQIVLEGGCNNPYNPLKPYENGQKYHPYIDSLGEYKCVTCKCKDGEQNCERQKCTKNFCHKMFRRQKKEVRPNEMCCSVQQCKKFRRNKNRKS